MNTFTSNADIKYLYETFIETNNKTILKEIYHKAKKDLTSLDENVLIELYAAGYEVNDAILLKVKENRYNVKDELLCFAAQNGDDNAETTLVTNLIPFVEDTIKRLNRKGRYNRGDELEDLIQSGYIGLYDAIKDFKLELKRSFKGFAQHVIVRHINSLITKANTNKMKSLNRSFSIQTPVSPDSDETFEQFLKSEDYQPVDLLIKDETFYEFWDLLSEAEKGVLWYSSEDYSYKEIGKIIFKDKITVKEQMKAVDNAIQRIGKKRELYLES